MTWIYVPSTSSVCVPEEADSISDSSWRFQVLEASCWSRGKPTRSRNWYQLWKRGLWLQRLCGAMCSPSAAETGVAQWTASLVESRANHTVSLASDSAKKTNAISGPMQGESSSSPGRGSASLKTSAAWSHRADSSEFGETFDGLVSRLRLDCSRRRKSAPVTSGSESSSSQWRTPTDDSNRGGAQSGLKRLQAGHTMNLQDQVVDFRVESARPTPATRDYKGANSADHLENGTGRKHLDQLPNFVQHIWSTPRASDGEKGSPNQDFGAGGTPLPAQAVQWQTPKVAPGAYTRDRGQKGQERLSVEGQARSETWSTPSVADVMGGRLSRDRDRSDELLMNGQAASLSSHLDQMTYPVGGISSTERRSLNPVFVEYLMGWPLGWTLLAWTDLGCSATALCHFKQRMRSELLRIGLPPEAPLVQPDLFG